MLWRGSIVGVVSCVAVALFVLVVWFCRYCVVVMLPWFACGGFAYVGDFGVLGGC